MSESLSYLTISEGRFSSDTVDVLKEMNALCERYGKTDDKKTVLDALHVLYWKSLPLIIGSSITEKTKQELVIPNEWRTWVALGHISPLLCSDCGKKLDGEDAVPPSAGMPFPSGA